MKRIGLATTALLVWGAATASAQGGINLAWDDCGTSGVQNLTFACNANSGAPFSAIASFLPPGTLPEFLGLNSQIDLRSQNAALPDWWKHGGDQCRGNTGLAISFDFTSGPFTCADFFLGQAAGGFVYEFPATPSSGDRGRIRVTCAVPFDNRGEVTEGTEYYAFKANILRAKTTAAGSCAGCAEAVCLVLDNIWLFQPPEQNNDPVLMNAANQKHVTWQSALKNCPQSTPTVNRTWGQVKSLYR
jgi:hypothetical protein